MFLSFSRTFCDYQGDFFKIQGQFKGKLHFFRIPGVFKDQGHFQGLFKVCANPVFSFENKRIKQNAVSHLPVHCHKRELNLKTPQKFTPPPTPEK